MVNDRLTFGPSDGVTAAEVADAIDEGLGWANDTLSEDHPYLLRDAQWADAGPFASGWIDARYVEVEGKRFLVTVLEVGR